MTDPIPEPTPEQAADAQRLIESAIGSNTAFVIGLAEFRDECERQGFTRMEAMMLVNTFMTVVITGVISGNAGNG